MSKQIKSNSLCTIFTISFTKPIWPKYETVPMREYIHVKKFSQDHLLKTNKQDDGSFNFMYVLIYLLHFVFKNI